MVTYYPLTLKEFIRGISTFCQLNRISINAEQLAKQYLHLFIVQFAFAFQSKPSQYSDILNSQLAQVNDIYGLVSSHTLTSKDRCTQKGVTDTNKALIMAPNNSYVALNREQQLMKIEQEVKE